MEQFCVVTVLCAGYEQHKLDYVFHILIMGIMDYGKMSKLDYVLHGNCG